MNVETPLVSMAECQPLLIFWQERGKRNAVLQYRAGSASTGFLQLTGCSRGCVLPCIFIPAVLLCSAPVSSEMSLIRKVCEKAIYIVILFGFFFIKPPADQAPLDMSDSEWIFIQCRKARKLTRAENFSGFQKAVVFFYHCSHQPAVRPASSHDLVGCLYVWKDLGGVRLPESLGCPTAEVHWCLMCHGWEAGLQDVILQHIQQRTVW